MMIPVATLAAEQPNILIFLVDDMGVMDTSVPFVVDAQGKPQVHPLNQYYNTPSMEALAKTGVRFSHFYANSVCSPSRASLLSGQYSARHKVTQWINPTGKNSGPKGWNWEGAKAKDITLQSTLRKAGYTTIHVGKAHLGPFKHVGADPLKVGFDINIAGTAIGRPHSYYGEKDYGKGNIRAIPHLDKYHGTDTFLTEALTLEAKATLTKLAKQDKPFFMHMSHYAVHAPFNLDPRFAAKYKTSGKGKSAQAFATLVEGMDKSLGDLIMHLEDIGEAENTLVVFLGDNGSDAPLGSKTTIASSAPYRGKKGTCLEGGMRAPLIIGWAKPSADSAIQKQFPVTQGIVSKKFVHICDLMPTILKVTGTNTPKSHVQDGQELTEFMAKHTGEHKQEFLMHFPHGHNSSNYTVLRKGDWKLVKHYGDKKQQGMIELFNVVKDISEENELSAKMPKKVEELDKVMQSRLDDCQAQYWAK